MIRKKSGATLIVVIITFMFLSTVSMAMLSMISANYRARVSESNRVENLYSSESGLDIAYNIMVKTFDAATVYGYYEVEALKKGNPSSINNQKYEDIQTYINEIKEKIKDAEDEIKRLRALDSDNKDKIKNENRKIQEYNEQIDKCNEMTDVLLNEEFKRAFKYFIKEPSSLEENEVAPNKLESSIKNKAYVNEVKGIDNSDFKIVTVNIPNTTKQTDEAGNEETFPRLSAENVDLKNTTEDSEKKSMSMDLELKGGKKEKITIDIVENDKYEITLQSIFQSTSENTNTQVVGNNIRTVQAKYNIFVPEYNDIFFGKGTDNITEYVVFDNKALMVGKEMKINDVTNLNVTGDVFVEGEQDSSNSINNDNRTFEKYSGGIIINYENGSNKKEEDRDNVVFNDDVITRGTFNLQDNIKVKIEKDLYAKNLYAGKISKINYSEGSVLNIDNVILDNDLTVKANKTHIQMDNFYGINDKNTKFNSGDKNYDNINANAGKERSSSSIIVNSPEADSTTKISDKAYIMGVAHINTENGYQTGESTAIKENYTAYAIPIDSEETFKYDDPLQVLDEDNVFNKAEHFSRYWNKVMNGQEWNEIDDVGKSINESGEKPKNGGIFLPSTIYSTGAIVYNDGEETIVKTSQYNLNVEADINDKRIDYASKVYRMGAETDINDYNLLGKYPDSVEDLIDFSGMSKVSGYDVDTELEECENNNDKEMAIFNSDSGTEIEIDGSKITVGGKEYNIGSTVKAVIVTAGDVTIKGNNGDVDFSGNIITCGNLNIESGKTKIKYDEEIINRIKLKNSDLFRTVFKNIATKEVSESSSTKEVELDDIKSQYNISEFLENKLWKLIK